MTVLLKVQDLEVEFSARKRKLHAVSGVSFELHKGETLGIVGESGCGKSATAKAITRLLPAYTSKASGQVIYQDQDLLSLSEKQMQRIRGKELGMIFQDPMTSLNPTLRIGTQIAEGYRRHNSQVSKSAAIDLAIQMLELVGIPEASSRIFEYPHTLSGGMRQRVMIALALACKPKILIADEPTTALDVTVQAQILKLMKDLQKKTETSIILITHDMSAVAGFCDRVLVMYAGKVVECASVEELFYRPQHPYTQQLLQAIPKMNLSVDTPLIPIEGHPPALVTRPVGCSFAPRCNKAMKICTQASPSTSQITPTHLSTCWIHQRSKIS